MQALIAISHNFHVSAYDGPKFILMPFCPAIHYITEYYEIKNFHKSVTKKMPTAVETVG